MLKLPDAQAPKSTNKSLESYNPAPNKEPPTRSKNLVHLSVSNDGNSVVHGFLKHAIMQQDQPQQHVKLFEALRLSLSYLFLNPRNEFLCRAVKQTNYDIGRVYLYESKFEIIVQVGTSFQNLIIKMDDLIHILNFWNYQLSSGNATAYGHMAIALAAQGRIAKSWSKPLQTFQLKDISAKWIGHYTCLHPYPKNKSDMAERQTCAEDWSSANPLVLDFSDILDEVPEKRWPYIFANMPAFQFDLNERCRYVRGTAYFHDMTSPSMSKRNSKRSNTLFPHMMSQGRPNDALTKLRMRGVIHPVSDQQGIPGWSRMLFVLYKPHDYHIIDNVLSYFASGDSDHDGDNNNKGKKKEKISMPSDENMRDLERAATAWTEYTNAVTQQLAAGDNQDQTLVRPNTADLLAKLQFNAVQVAQIEDDGENPGNLQWSDIEFAYAYEGILTPGGKVMLGRFWKIVIDDIFVYQEGAGSINGDVVYDEDDYDEDEDLAVGVSRKDLGSFIFWTDD